MTDNVFVLNIHNKIETTFLLAFVLAPQPAEQSKTSSSWPSRGNSSSFDDLLNIGPTVPVKMFRTWQLLCLRGKYSPQLEGDTVTRVQWIQKCLQKLIGRSVSFFFMYESSVLFYFFLSLSHPLTVAFSHSFSISSLHFHIKLVTLTWLAHFGGRKK